jgi:hypothetical protein
VTTVLDGFAPIGLQDAVVPFRSGYRPVWLGLGAVALDLVLALALTSLVRARIGYRAWRALHWAAYAAWPLALVHALGAGSDPRSGWMRVIVAAVAAAVAVAVLVRIGRAAAQPAAARGLRIAAVLVAALAVSAWYATGPGRRGWAARAGTPASLRAAPAAARVARPAVRRAVAALPQPPYRAPVRGRLTASRRADGLAIVDLRGRTGRPAAGVLWIRIQGRPLDDGGLAMTASGVRYGPSAAPSRYVGSVASLAGTRLVLALHGPQGPLRLRVRLRIDQAAGSFAGTVEAS